MLPLNVWNLSYIGCQWCAGLAQRRQHTFPGSEVAAPTHGGKHLQTYLAQEIGEAHDEYAPGLDFDRMSFAAKLQNQVHLVSVAGTKIADFDEGIAGLGKV
jgi:hypothetical protein